MFLATKIAYTSIREHRIKIILVVLPILIVSVVLAGMASRFMATCGGQGLPLNSLDFKASELEKYAESQWNLLVENGVSDRPDMAAAAKAGVESFARAIVQGSSELIIAMSNDGSIDMRTASVETMPEETESLKALFESSRREFLSIELGGVKRVATGFPFGPFGWYVLVSQERSAFYGEVEAITQATFIILAVSLIAATVLVLLVVRHLLHPLSSIGHSAMRAHHETPAQMSERVEVEFPDEIGTMSHTF
ncbi:hypothetical protein MASR2M48_33500 [Spirochaetota bacterium]